MRKPRLAFIGLGWIGKHRMEAVLTARAAEIVACVDPDPEARERARVLAPGAESLSRFEDALHLDLDGIVIATPSALHGSQVMAALERRLAVFCQKPLARGADETRRLVAAAERADRLLHVDLSYRHTEALKAARALVRSGELGRVYAAELTFHNAYGPDKDWFYDPTRSGGGCLIDLGIHLVDAGLWTLDFPEVESVTSRLYAGGELLPPSPAVIEDHAVARLDVAGGATLQLACSWNLHAGCDAVIGAAFYGTAGAAVMRNVGGSFFDFETVRHAGTRSERLVSPPDDWGGRAIVAFARRLAESPAFDPSARDLTRVAEALDRCYGR